MNDAVVKACRCDLCHKREVGVEYHQHGVPVLFVCRRCQPAAVSDVAAITLVSALLEALLPSG